jgi:hypothetical protein
LVIVQALAMFEGLVGQLKIAITLARLVSLGGYAPGGKTLIQFL